MAAPNRFIRSKSQRGHRPPCRGKVAAARAISSPPVDEVPRGDPEHRFPASGSVPAGLAAPDRKTAINWALPFRRAPRTILEAGVFYNLSEDRPQLGLLILRALGAPCRRL